MNTLMKLAGAVIDPYDDPNFVGSPDVQARFGKGLLDPEGIRDLPDRDFGVILKTAAATHRKFPLSTPDLTKVSAAYFLENQGQLPGPVREAARHRIKTAADRHGVELGAPFEGTQPPEGATFHIRSAQMVTDDAEGDKTALAAAENEFIVNFDRMHPLHRAEAATALAKIGAVEDPRTWDYVQKDQFGPRLQTGLEQRAALAKTGMLQGALRRTVTKMAEAGPAGAPLELVAFDRAAGIEGRVLDAVQTCWGGFPLRKVADQFGVGKLDPLEYKIDTLGHIHSEQVKQVFDEQTALAFNRDPLGFYRRASGQIKRVLRELAMSVGEQQPSAEVHRECLPAARKAIRPRQFTPWAKRPVSA